MRGISISPRRWFSRCLGYKPRIGGKEHIYANGTRYKWVCANCSKGRV